jgi:hypothetical protein
MKNPPGFGGFWLHFKVERATGLEPATATLARWYSTIELRARWMGSRPNALPSVKPLDEPRPDGLGSRGKALLFKQGSCFIREEPPQCRGELG